MTTLTLASITSGESLPAEDIPVTTRLIVAGAIATRDYQNVHHDSQAAREAGTQDVFMNILTTNGLIGRYVTDWAGPHARIRRIAVKLGVPNFPGDTMTLSGQVESIDPEEFTVTVRVSGTNQLGEHVGGAVSVILPG